MAATVSASRSGITRTTGRSRCFRPSPLNPAGTYIGSNLQVAFDSSKLAADINTIFSLRVVSDSSNTPLWSPDTVTICQVKDSGGTTTDLVTNVKLKGTTFYSSNPPRPGVRGFIYDTSTTNAAGSPAITVKAGQMLTVRVDPGQQWLMGGVPSNCNGPLHDFDSPYLTQACSHLSYTYKRGAFVINIVTQNNTDWPAVVAVGNYLRVPVLADGTVTWNVWDDAFANNQGKFGVSIEIEDFDFGEYATNPPPKSIQPVLVKPQLNCVSLGVAGLADTGIDLKLGDVLHLRCDPYDTWVINAGANLSVNANGIFSPTSGQNNPVANYYWLAMSSTYRYFANGCLLGTLDEGKTLFAVGTSLDMTIQQAGRLKLVCWDDSPANNTDDIKAYIWSSKAPYMPDGGSTPSQGGGDPASLTLGITPGGALISYVSLTNGGSSDVDVSGLTLVISTCRPVVGFYTFPANSVIKAGAEAKVWIGDKAGEPYSFKSAAPMLYGPGKDRVSLVRLLVDKHD